MKIICTKHEFADLVRNCAEGDCTQCALAGACCTFDNGKLENCEEAPVTVVDFVTRVITEAEST